MLLGVLGPPCPLMSRFMLKCRLLLKPAFWPGPAWNFPSCGLSDWARPHGTPLAVLYSEPLSQAGFVISQPLPGCLSPADRVIEERELKAILRPLGLRIQPIPPDGHCLYRSLGVCG